MSAIAKLQLAVWKAMYVKWLCNGNSDCNERKYTASMRPQPSSYDQLATTIHVQPCHGRVQPRLWSTSHDCACAIRCNAFITRVHNRQARRTLKEDDNCISEVDRQQFQSEYISMDSIMQVNGNKGKFTSVQPGDHIIATTIYKHGRVKKLKGIVLGDKKPKERKRHSCPKMPSFIPVSLDLSL